MVMKLSPVVTMAGVDHILGGRMAEWARLRALEENGLNIRRICRVRIPLPKKSIDWADGTEVTSRRYYGWHRPHFFGSRMAEWLRLRAFEENGLNIRRICEVRLLLPKKFIGWVNGTKVTYRRYYGWHRPHFCSRMAEWLRLRAFEKNGLNIRWICGVRILLPNQKSIGWADGDEKHVPSLLWLA